MSAISPSVSAGVFYPDDIESMFLAYKEVCHALHINGDAGARESIARRVIELARCGELRPKFLRDMVLAETNSDTQG